MEFDIQHLSGSAVVRISGDVDLVSSPTLLKAALDLLRGGKVGSLVINMSGVDYIDSSGVASLIELLQVSRRRRANLRLACLNKGPRDVLNLTRLLDVFEVHATEKSALGA